jgi:hypothetical protein
MWDFGTVCLKIVAMDSPEAKFKDTVRYQLLQVCVMKNRKLMSMCIRRNVEVYSLIIYSSNACQQAAPLPQQQHDSSIIHRLMKNEHDAERLAQSSTPLRSCLSSCDLPHAGHNIPTLWHQRRQFPPHRNRCLQAWT